MDVSALVLPSAASIRKMAEAICRSLICEGYACCQWDANRGRTLAGCPVQAGGYDPAAKAAIETALQIVHE